MASSSRRGWLGSSPGPQPSSQAVRGPRPPRGWLLIGLLVVLAGLALWKVPEWQVAPERSRLAASTDVSTSDRLLLEKELFQAENAARGTLALILGAAGLLLGLGVAWRRFETARQARSQERFGQAVEQLASERADGSPRTETRLGGIYALERLALESESEYWPVMEVLTAYLRENGLRTRAQAASSGPVRPGADVQAIVGVLGRRGAPPPGERRLLDLRETDLRGANLSAARLEGVTLHGAWLQGADATRADFVRANLREADLSATILSGADLQGAALARANLEGARLNGADLRGADLSGANLRAADLWQANLRGCNLKDADLRGADLSQADLQEAILWRADLSDATLNGARLKETHLERANLSGATGLTWEQGKDAFTDENTILPDYLYGRAVRPAPPRASRTQPRVQSALSASPAARGQPRVQPASSVAPRAPSVSAAEPFTPPEPAPTRSRVVVSSSPPPAPASPRQPRRARDKGTVAAAANVVQLQEAIRTASRTPPPLESAPAAEPKPGGKKLARPRRRHPALVAPPRSA